jgi:hypothetical protein
MAISYIGRGDLGASVSTLTPDMPSGIAVGDLVIIHAETSNASIAVPDDWTTIFNQTNGATVSASNFSRHRSFYRVYDGVWAMPLLADPGDHIIAYAVAFRGVDTSNPIDNSGSLVAATSDVTSIDFPAHTTVTDGALLVFMAVAPQVRALNIWTTSHGYTIDNPISLASTIGDDGTVYFATADAGAAGVKSAPTSTLTISSSNRLAGCVFALRPSTGGTDITVDGTLPAFIGSAEVTSATTHTISGTVPAFGGAVDIVLGANIIVTGSLPAFSGESLITNGLYNITAGGEVPAFGGSAEILPGQLIDVNGEVPAFGGAAFVAMPIGILGEVAAFGGSAEIELTALLTLDGVLPAFGGDASVLVNFTLDHVIEGSIAAFGGSAEVETPCYRKEDDKRELILERLAEVLAAVPGVVTFGRNDPTVPESTLPAVLLLDADEEAHEPTHGRGRPVPSPNWVTMRPEVHIIVEEDPEDLGNTMNLLAERITDAVLNDSELQDLCKDDEMAYEGLGMSLDMGRTMVGEIELTFAFTYVLWPLYHPCTPYAEIEYEGDTTREFVLDAMHKILQEVPGVSVVLRNDVSVPEDSTPAVVLLDGDETADAGAVAHSHPGHAPNIVRMAPEIYIIASDRPDLAGPKLNEIRMMVIRYIFNDPTLRSLLYSGDLRYEGCQTSLALGRSLTGEMGMIISAARKRD